MRPTPTNTQKPLATLYDGDTVYPLNTGYKQGTGSASYYWYQQVWVCVWWWGCARVFGPQEGGGGGGAGPGARMQI